MNIINIDGKNYKVNSKNNLLHSCLSIGINIPYFCWHPSLGSIGACRQCAVKLYKNKYDINGKIIMSCMTGITNNMYISINDIDVITFRKNVIEWMMINHPHDCPVCEEGGNCHLQDMTIITEHKNRRYNFNKRTHENQNLGPFISHEMNRCISCYRCIRYYKDYAGGKDLGVFGMNNNIYFGRINDGMLESEFSGNITDICPTGVFTDKTYSYHYTRKWDLQYAPSICNACSVGCNISPGERYGKIRKIENRYNGLINKYFICDRGRFGYNYLNNNRPYYPKYKKNNNNLKIEDIFFSFDTAIKRGAFLLRNASRIIGIGSTRASIESNFALLMLVGLENFSTGIKEEELQRLKLMIKINQEFYSPSVRDIEEHDVIIILGEDVTQTAARIALAIRQSANNYRINKISNETNIPKWNINAINNCLQDYKSPIYIASVYETKLDDIARGTFYGTPEDITNLGYTLANAIDKKAPKVIDEFYYNIIDDIVESLKYSTRPLIITGESLNSISILHAAANLTKALKVIGKSVSLTFISKAANSTGLAILDGKSIDWALKNIVNKNADTVIILENDLYLHNKPLLVDKALNTANTIIVIDHQKTKTWEKAHLVLPTANFVESNGTLVNYEGRAQRFFKVYDPIYYNPNCLIKESWQWLHTLNVTIKNSLIEWKNFDNVVNACSKFKQELYNIKKAAPLSSFRIKGKKLSRSPSRYSGRTSMLSNININEPGQTKDKDTAFAFSMEGYFGHNEFYSQIPFTWSPGLNSSQACNKFHNVVGGNLRFGDPGIILFNKKKKIKNLKLNYFKYSHNIFKKQINNWQIIPIYHLFGSEETSSISKPIQKCIPEPYVLFNYKDIIKLGLNKYSKIYINVNTYKLNLSIRISNVLPHGIIGIPILSSIPSDIFGSWATITTEIII
ncbi:NADH-quinone oxidoreductase subunit G [Candidatus Johnevansia muelleri]|uniref:NADH-quinone oxidoreductase n=1 Tax=Candidatus Johnevansia muelleri TaxID=1495769 RepID=A0A078KED3_9GAMM|nr:NADH-quinone oxidoreductase subunit G [Candidatus Evansia muelleri]